MQAMVDRGDLAPGVADPENMRDPPKIRVVVRTRPINPRVRCSALACSTLERLQHAAPCVPLGVNACNSTYLTVPLSSVVICTRRLRRDWCSTRALQSQACALYMHR